MKDLSNPLEYGAPFHAILRDYFSKIQIENYKIKPYFIIGNVEKPTVSHPTYNLSQITDGTKPSFQHKKIVNWSLPKMIFLPQDYKNHSFMKTHILLMYSFVDFLANQNHLEAWNSFGSRPISWIAAR